MKLICAFLCSRTQAQTFFAGILSSTSALRRNVPQILAVTLKNVMLIGFGMTLGFPTVLIGGLEDSHRDFHLSEEQLSWIGAINLIFVPLGCLCSGPYCERFGRKRAMQMANVPLACVWIMFRYATSTWHLYTGLAAIGILLGLIEAPVVTYVAEITTPNLRGILFTSSTIFLILGTLCSFLLGSLYYWRSVAQICFFMPVVAINLLCFIPESPLWLVKKQRLAEAQWSLAWLRGWLNPADVQQEYNRLLTSVRSSTSANTRSASTCSSYATRSFLRPYSLITSVFFIRHFSGMSNIQTYAVDIFAHLHAPIDKYNATIIMGICELLGCLTCASLIRKCGKRRLTFAAMLLSGVSLVTIPVYHYGGLGHHHNWIPTTGLLSYTYFSHCSLRTLPWVLIGEVYTPETRSVASGISAGTGYVFGFLANKLYFIAVHAITLNGLIIVYIVILLLGLVLFYFTMPETEGKTLEEVCNYFASHTTDELLTNKDGSKYYCPPDHVSAENGQIRLKTFTGDRRNSFNSRPSYKKFCELSNDHFY